MDCKEFLSSYTDYRDGLLSDRDVARVEVHLSGCASCRRYRQVVDEGIRELRSLPTVSTSDDFRPRLRHRIYHVEDGDTFFGDGSRGSGTTAVAAVGIAVLFTAAAWTPILRQAGNSVTVPAIVVSQPPGSSARAEVRLPPSAFFREDDSWRRGSSPRWSPPSSLWTSGGGSWSSASSPSPGLRATSPVRSMSTMSLGRTSPGPGRLLGASGVSLSPLSQRPTFFNAASSSLRSESGRSSLGLD